MVSKATWPTQKRRAVGRHAANQKDPLKEFFAAPINLTTCKENLLGIADEYMKASVEHDREWEDEKVRHEWSANVRKAASIKALAPLVD